MLATQRRGQVWVSLNLCCALFSVIPAKAGIHPKKSSCPQRIPAFAGMTENAMLSVNAKFSLPPENSE